MLLAQPGGHLSSCGPPTQMLPHMLMENFCSIFPQSIMLRWQPPPPSSQNGEIINYKIKYRKGSRRSETSDSTSGSQLSKLISGNDG